MVMLTREQQAFVDDDARELLFPNMDSASGKSYALVQSALKYSDNPHYRALLLYQTPQQAREVMRASFPPGLLRSVIGWSFATLVADSGAMIFVMIATEALHSVQGSEWNFIGCDEAPIIGSERYRFLLSRLRYAPEWANDARDVPLRMRCAQTVAAPAYASALPCSS